MYYTKNEGKLIFNRNFLDDNPSCTAKNKYWIG